MKDILPGIDIRIAVTAALLLAGAWVVLRSAMPRSGHEGPKHAGERKRARRERPEPAPIAGGATMLLESIPYLERVRTGRGRGTVKLVATIGFAAAIVAGLFYGVGHVLGQWLSSLANTR